MSSLIRKVVAISLSGAVLSGGVETASAISTTKVSVSGVVTAGTTLTKQTSSAGKNLSDYGIANLAWTHTAAYVDFQVGTAAQIADGTGAPIDVEIQLQQSATSSPKLTYPAFGIWTSGRDDGSTYNYPGALMGGATYSGFGHAFSLVRGSFDGGRSIGEGAQDASSPNYTSGAMSNNDDPCLIGSMHGFRQDGTEIFSATAQQAAANCLMGTNAHFSITGNSGNGNIVEGRNGWVGYATAAYSYCGRSELGV